MAVLTPWDRLLHFVLPSFCLGCGEPLPASATLGLCRACRGKLVRLDLARCPICWRPNLGAATAGAACASCRTAAPSCDRLLAAWSYQEPLASVLLAFKFGRLDYLGSALARAIAELLRETLSTCDLVVPVPLHWRRRLARGYNQAERIARPLAARLQIPLRTALRRRRPTPAQSQLDRAERLRNLADAFAVWRPGAVAGRRILLVDDVVTTGATVEAAAASLRAAGAAEIHAVAAARTPREKAPVHPVALPLRSV